MSHWSEGTQLADQTSAEDGLGAASTLLSVVIPAYNCASFLNAAVSSTQTLGVSNVEVVVVDDGSTDDTPARIAALQLQLPGLIAIRQANAGLSAARNAGIARCTGRYVLLLDADDELIACDLKSELAAGIDVIRVGVEEVEIGGDVRRWVDAPLQCRGIDYMEAGFSRNDFFTPSWAYIYRREWLQEQGLQFEVGLLHEDNLFTVQALVAASTLRTTDTLVYRYIRRPGSITSAPGEKRLRARIDALLYITRRMLDMANARPDVDLRWKIHDLIHNAQHLAVQCHSPLPRWRVLWQLTWLMMTYRGAGGHGFRYLERRRFRQVARAAWNPRKSNYRS